MAPTTPTRAGDVRVADLAGVLSLATDLGMGFPWEHGLQATLAAMRLCDLLDVDTDTRREAYYVTLLFYVGCTSDAAEDSRIVRGSKTDNIIPFIWGTLPESLRGLLRAMPEADASAATRLRQRATGLPRAMLVLRDHQRAYCDIATALSARLGVTPEISRRFYFITDHWDGSGALRRARGESIPLSVRIAFVARDGAFLHALWGARRARETLVARRGKAHDPLVVEAFAAHSDEVLAAVGASSSRADVLAAEPQPHLLLDPTRLDDALAAMGNFADLISPSMAAHSGGVSAVAGRAAELMGMDEPTVLSVRRAARIQDLGRVAVDAAIWEKPAPLTADELEQVRLHPYLTDRVLSASTALADLAPLAACHHERLDGSGYHRGLPAPMLPVPARVLAAADEFRALTQPRPYRPALSDVAAAEQLRQGVASGRLDADAVSAVIEAAGMEAGTVERPRGLTARETQVVGLLARGMATKQVARRLGISPKTADRHVQSAYRKIGVSSRAALALFAMQHGLVAWGELPVGGDATAS